jgi:Concanavalin A-like lectin/glucanases superfamily
MFHWKKSIITAMLLGGCTLLVSAAEKKDADLIGYWGFNEGKGETTKDLSGNGNPGKILNGKWVGNGITGKALQFNGVDTFVDFGKSKLFDISKDYTISVWLKIGKVKKGMTIMNKAGWSKGWQWYIFRSFTALTSRGFGKKSPIYYRKFAHGKLKSSLFLGDLYYNLVLTSKTEGENTIVTYYVNGKKGKSFSIPGGKLTVNSNVPLTLGKYASAEAACFSGIMDEVKLYKRALTPKEIKKAYDDLTE